MAALIFSKPFVAMNFLIHYGCCLFVISTVDHAIIIVQTVEPQIPPYYDYTVLKIAFVVGMNECKSKTHKKC